MQKISQVIAKLQEHIDQYGDADLDIYDTDRDNFHRINNVVSDAKGVILYTYPKGDR